MKVKRKIFYAANNFNEEKNIEREKQENEKVQSLFNRCSRKCSLKHL
jgi:hypothetical protein